MGRLAEHPDSHVHVWRPQNLEMDLASVITIRWKCECGKERITKENMEAPLA
jgi:hypothetical protein